MAPGWWKYVIFGKGGEVISLPSIIVVLLELVFSESLLLGGVKGDI